MTETAPDTRTSSTTWAIGGGGGVVIAIAALVRLLDQGVPAWTKGAGFDDIAAVIEYPVHARPDGRTEQLQPALLASAVSICGWSGEGSRRSLRSRRGG